MHALMVIAVIKHSFKVVLQIGTAQVTPRGVQLVLGNKQDPAIVDTIVMANLGYFQLKARPGAFALQLAQGRSQMLYAVDETTVGVASQVSPAAHHHSIKVIVMAQQAGLHMCNHDESLRGYTIK